LTEIDGDQDGTADDGQGQEDIPAHVGEAQKDGGIHSDPVGHVLFLGMQNRMEPGEKALADGRRRVFLIGMLELGSIDNVVARTEEGEKEGKEEGDPNGGPQGSPDGGYLELSSPEKKFVSGYGHRYIGNHDGGRRAIQCRTMLNNEGEPTCDLKGFWMRPRNLSVGDGSVGSRRVRRPGPVRCSQEAIIAAI
jgi:hypothetical protein